MGSLMNVLPLSGCKRALWNAESPSRQSTDAISKHTDVVAVVEQNDP